MAPGSNPRAKARKALRPARQKGRVKRKLWRWVVLISYKSLPTEVDWKLDRVARSQGGERSGSGFCFIRSRRDISYMFLTRRAADAFARKAEGLSSEAPKLAVKVERYGSES